MTSHGRAMKQCDRDVYARGYRDGMLALWKIMQDIDAKHSEYPMPFELYRRYKTLLGSVEDYIYERGGEQNGDDVLRD